VNRRAAIVLAVLSTAAILFLTLSPGVGPTRGWDLTLTSGDDALAGLIQNLLLFIPLGVSLTLAGVRPSRVIAAGALLSFCVEFAQQWIPGRDPSLGDIVNNTISTGLGVLLVAGAPIWLWAPPRRSTWQAVATALIAMLAWYGTAAMVRQTFPPLPYSVLTTPDLEHFGQYKGKVVDVRPGMGRMDIVAIAAPKPPPLTSPLIAVVDQQGNKVLMLSVDHYDLTLRYSMPAVRATLEQPDLRFRGAMRPIAPGDSFIAGTWHDSTNICLRVNASQQCGLGYTIGDGWKLIYYPESWPRWELAVINTLWVLGCVIGVGLWGARSDSRWIRGLVIAAVILASIIIPLATGLKPTPLTEFLGVVGGLVFGWYLGARVLVDRPL
jgi:hypothetical protein